MAVPDEATVTVLDIKTACNILCGGNSVDPQACRGAGALRDILLGTAQMRPIPKSDPAPRSESLKTRPVPKRWRLPENRAAITHKFTVDGTRGYVIVGMYADGEPGELFIKLHQVGSMEHGMADAFSTLFSIALQFGIPLGYLILKFKHMKFQPAGVTDNQSKDLRFADSIIDYIIRWLEIKFIHRIDVDGGQS